MLDLLRIPRMSIVYALKMTGTCTVVCGFAASALGAWQSPLTEVEQAQSVTIALSADITVSNVPPRAALAAVDKHPLGMQVLLSELRETKGALSDSVRQVEVFLFDYERGVTLLKLVDVSQGTVLSSQVINSVYLPLSDEEIEFARARLLKDPELRMAVSAELNNVNGYGSGNFNVEDLQARISVWVPTEGTAAKSSCTQQRCALVSLFTNDDYSLSVEPVVNLSGIEIYLDLF